MKGLLFTLLSLISFQAFCQKKFTMQELIDLYLSKPRAESISFVEAKGYVRIESSNVASLFTPEDIWFAKNGEQILFEFCNPKNGTERFGLGFTEQGVTNLVCYLGPTEGIENCEEELKALNFYPTKTHDDMSKLFEKRKTDFFVWYELHKNGIWMLSVLPKNGKEYKLLSRH